MRCVLRTGVRYAVWFEMLQPVAVSSVGRFGLARDYRRMVEGAAGPGDVIRRAGSAVEAAWLDGLRKRHENVSSDSGSQLGLRLVRGRTRT